MTYGLVQVYSVCVTRVCTSVRYENRQFFHVLWSGLWAVFQCCTVGAGACIWKKKCMHSGEESLDSTPDPCSKFSAPGFGSDI